MDRTAVVSPTVEAVRTPGELLTEERGHEVGPCPFAVLGLTEEAGSNAVHSRWLDIQNRFEECGGCEARYMMQAAAVCWIQNAREEGEVSLAEPVGWESVLFLKVGSREHDFCMEITSRIPLQLIHLDGSGMPAHSRCSQETSGQALPTAAERPWRMVHTVTDEVRADDDAGDALPSASAASCLWFYFRSEKPNTNWEPHDAEEQDALRRAWATGTRIVSLVRCGGRCEVDLNTLTQTTADTGEQRRIRVQSGPVEAAV